MESDILLFNGFPPESSGTVTELHNEIKQRSPDIKLTQATDYDSAARLIPEAEILIEHKIPDELLERASSLQWIQSLSAGVNRYDLDRLSQRDVFLTTISGAHAQPIAEHVLGYMLFFERDFRRVLQQQNACRWRRFPAGELGSKTVGVVGVGEIGGRIAEVAAGVGMRVIGTKRDTSVYNDAVEDIYPADELHTVLKKADYIVLACPLTDETAGLIGQAELSSMKDNAVLINIARGGVIVQEHLTLALQEGYLGGAALDVSDPEPLPPESPLWNMDDVIITPHMAGGSPEFPRRCAEIFVHNLDRFTDGNHGDMRNRML